VSTPSLLAIGDEAPRESSLIRRDLDDTLHGMAAGQVVIHSAKIATGQVGGQFTLLHVPTDRFVVLYDTGREIWTKLEAGTTDIGVLVQEHARDHGVPLETAAYEVISFLDELRAQGFIDFALEREREAAPLLDAQTGLADMRAEHVLRWVGGKRPFDTHPLRRVATIDDPPDTMTLAELRAAADAAPAAAAAPPPTKQASVTRQWFAIPQPSAALSIDEIERLVGARKGVPAFQQRRIVHLHGPAMDLTVRELETVANLGLDTVDVDRRGGVDVLDDVRPDLTIGELESTSLRRARVIVIVVIVLGPDIVIVIIDGGPGPSAGKSRQACKTMCV